MIRFVLVCVWLGGCVVDVPVFVERDADVSDVPQVDTHSADTTAVDSDTGASADTNQPP